MCERRLLKAKVRRAVAYWTNRNLLGGVLAWKSALGARRRLRRSVAHWRQQQLATAMERWCAMVGYYKRTRLVLSRVLSRMRHQLMLRAFMRWRWSTNQKAHSRDVGMRTVCHWQQGELAKAFNAWESEVVRRRRRRVIMARSLARIQSRTLMRGFVRWIEHAAEKRRLKGRASRGVAVWKHSHAARAFASWAAAVMWRLSGGCWLRHQLAQRGGTGVGVCVNSVARNLPPAAESQVPGCGGLLRKTVMCGGHSESNPSGSNGWPSWSRSEVQRVRSHTCAHAQPPTSASLDYTSKRCNTSSSSPDMVTPRNSSNRWPSRRWVSP